jgi:hypothetical protein
MLRPGLSDAKSGPRRGLSGPGGRCRAQRTPCRQVKPWEESLSFFLSAFWLLCGNTGSDL